MTWGTPVNASRRRGFALLISLALGCVSDEPTTSTDAGEQLLTQALTAATALTLPRCLRSPR